jgi:hypothetical protein
LQELICAALFPKLLGLRSTYRANTSASSALNAFLRIDNVLAVSLGNSLSRAFCCTSATSDAVITNYICHNSTSLILKELELDKFV